MRVSSLILAFACLACSAPGAQAVDTSKLIDKALQIVSKENIGIASAVGGVWTALNAVNEEITSRQEHRQDDKRSLRDKAAATADFVVVFCVVAAQNHASLHCLRTGSFHGDLQEQPEQGQGHQGPGRGRVDRCRRRAAALQVRLLAPPPRSTPA